MHLIRIGHVGHQILFKRGLVLRCFKVSGDAISGQKKWDNMLFNIPYPYFFSKNKKQPSAQGNSIFVGSLLRYDFSKLSGLPTKAGARIEELVKVILKLWSSNFFNDISDEKTGEASKLFISSYFPNNKQQTTTWWTRLLWKISQVVVCLQRFHPCSDLEIKNNSVGICLKPSAQKSNLSIYKYHFRNSLIVQLDTGKQKPYDTRIFFMTTTFGWPQLHGVLRQVVLRIVAREEVQNLSGLQNSTGTTDESPRVRGLFVGTLCLSS